MSPLQTAVTVLREPGTDDFNFFECKISDWMRKPSQCLTALKSRNGRKKVHDEYPAFDDEGNAIPE